jgi:hypothetical protein
MYIPVPIQTGGNQNEKLNLKKPEMFSGKRREDLEPFIAACRNIFLAEPNRYQTEHSKILYTASFFSDDTLCWWSDLLPDMELAQPTNYFLDNYTDFIDELVRNFGITNPRADAIGRLTELTMPANGSVARFYQKFLHLAPKTGYNDIALADMFFEKLPKRITDVFANRLAPRPTSLSALASMAEQADENQVEQKRLARHTTFGTESGGSKKESKTEVRKTTTTQHQATTNPSSGHRAQVTTSSSSSSSKSSPSKPTDKRTDKPKVGTEDLSKKLTKSGELTKDERDRRIKENLCLYCGKPGHKAIECRARLYAQARLASITEIEAEEGTEAHISDIESEKQEN